MYIIITKVTHFLYGLQAAANLMFSVIGSPFKCLSHITSFMSSSDSVVLTSSKNRTVWKSLL